MPENLQQALQPWHTEQRFIHLIPELELVVIAEPAGQRVEHQHEWHAVGEVFHRRRGDQRETEHQAEQGKHQVDQSPEGRQQADRQVDVEADLLSVEAGPDRELLHSEEDLHVALHPAQALVQKIGKGAWHLAHAQHLVEVAHGPAPRQQLGAGLVVFNQAAGHIAADRFEGAAPHHIGGATADHRVGAIADHLQIAEEVIQIARHDHLKAEIAVVELRLEIVLRGLNQGHLGIAEESHGALQEPGKRHEIAVEDGDELGAGVGQGMVEVARLAVGIAVAGQIVHPQLGRQGSNLGPMAVIQHGDRAMGIAEVAAGEDRPSHDPLRLVIGGDPHIYRGRGLLYPRLQLIGLATAQVRIEADGGQQLQAGGEDVEQLGAKQQHAAGQAQGVGGVECGGPPEEVAQGEPHQHQFDQPIAPSPPG